MDLSKYWNNKLDELERTVISKQVISKQELNNWVADCVAVFSHLGVGSDIIRGFMNLFEKSDGISSGQKWDNLFELWHNPARQKDRISGFFYPNIAFTTARKLILNLAENERLVPQRLIDLLKTKLDYSNLVASLESIQASYELKDIDILLSSTIALLQDILNLHHLLLNKKISIQLKELMDKKNKVILQDFGSDPELIEIFYSFRYLRNKVSQHKLKANSKVTLPKPPLSAGHGFASLVLLFLYCVMSEGKLIIV